MIDAQTFRTVLGHYPTGVCVITSETDDGVPLGMSVGTFTSVSLDPPLVAFLPGRNSGSWKAIEASGRFCVNVLGADQKALSQRFAMPSEDRFAAVRHSPSPLGSPIIDGVVAWIDCRIHAVHAAGDHVFVVGAVASLNTASGDQKDRPLLYHKGCYRQVA